MSCADMREREKSVGIVAVLMERTLKYSALTQRLDAYCSNVQAAQKFLGHSRMALKKVYILFELKDPVG